MAKHTKGNWKVDDSIEYEISIVSPWSAEVRPGDTPTFGDYRGAIICKMDYNSGVPTKKQALANARLIAAAPDMFEALKSIIDYWNNSQKGSMNDHIEHSLKLAEAAIKKAIE